MTAGREPRPTLNDGTRDGNRTPTDYRQLLEGAAHRRRSCRGAAPRFENMVAEGSARPPDRLGGKQPSALRARAADRQAHPARIRPESLGGVAGLSGRRLAPPRLALDPPESPSCG